MATAVYSGCSFADGAVTIELEYDDVTLAVLDVRYANATALNAQAVVTPPTGPNRTYTVPANTPETTTSLANLNLTMTRQQVVHNGITYQIVSLPAGYQVSYVYPA